ncbi:hypothetical protein [Paraburkholderia sp. GAS348]|uniref:hypothetical protein n=1 Tax=Paraburkholderia sp. GAS348 TaxID=3035132 RepID=UPI003D2606EA
MPGKSRNRKHTRPAMSPLLRALTYSRAAHEPVTRAMLLQCYTALDAFRRGQGSRDLFATLSRHLLAAEELCRLGLASDQLANIESAHTAMVHVKSAKHHDGSWMLRDSEYSLLCAAFAILDAQLSIAALDEIARAEARVVEGLIRAEQKQAIAEASM